ncbi:adenine-specific methyltransferase EcoRI family protein [Lactiplantibacillus plantarum]|uniref:adenine-specific methyltransferase EcoRI family protein n=2 Tax=Lactobacillaceae TaxID=33958 RepID=UPI0008637B07|nr:adenine-specific methyltransferase EcoRI family protein [Lactiplantibacillus plantarum]
MVENGNNNLHVSRAKKTDEFYTELSLIEDELKHYRDYFQDKIVFCNCDDPAYSNFWRYFQLNFYKLGLKKLVSTHYESTKKSYKLEIIRQNDKIGQLSFMPDYVQTPLEQNGDFRSSECIEILKEADVVVTNPPFSLFREYINQLIEYKKKFIVIGNQNAVTYKEILPLVMENKMWLGYKSGHFWFRVPDSYEEKKTDFKIDETGQKWRRMGNICWFTNIDIEKRHENMTLFRNYIPEKYPKYDNYNAIEVSRTADIPVDYFDVMGVPITFMTKYNPDQFLILGDSRYHDGQDFSDDINVIDGKTKFRRLLIKRRKE